MDKDKQRIAIAEVCGWAFDQTYNGGFGGWGAWSRDNRRRPVWRLLTI